MLPIEDVRYIRDTIKETLSVCRDELLPQTLEGIEPELEECLDLLEDLL